jgi:hypothetical protein
MAITEVEGKFECPGITNQQECAILIEKELLRANPQLAHRANAVLRIRLQNGSYFTIEDELERYNVIDVQAGGRFATVRQQFHEGNTWHVLDLRSGRLTETSGYPLFSPSGSKFVSASMDLLAGYSATVLDVYVVTRYGVTRVFRGIPPDQVVVPWGPGRVRWLDDNTIAFMRTTSDASANESETPATLALRGGMWRINFAN